MSGSEVDVVECSGHVMGRVRVTAPVVDLGGEGLWTVLQGDVVTGMIGVQDVVSRTSNWEARLGVGTDVESVTLDYNTAPGSVVSLDSLAAELSSLVGLSNSRGWLCSGCVLVEFPGNHGDTSDRPGEVGSPLVARFSMYSSAVGISELEVDRT